MLIEALGWLVLARLTVRLVPFPRLARWLGPVVPPADERVVSASAGCAVTDGAVASDVGWAVRRAARHSPIRAVCLPQAIAARMMLHRRRVASVIHFGGAIVADPGGFDAHAWVNAAGVEVSGYPVPPGITEIACLVSKAN